VLGKALRPPLRALSASLLVLAITALATAAAAASSAERV
jgi:hypothetical protein